MQQESKSAAATALERYFDSPANYAHALSVADLVLDRLPNGELAWLRAEPPTNEVRYVLTEDGCRALDEDCRARALAALFGQPWPTVAEACRDEVA